MPYINRAWVWCIGGKEAAMDLTSGTRNTRPANPLTKENTNRDVRGTNAFRITWRD